MIQAPSQPVTLRFAWSSPSGRVTAIFRAEVVRYELEGHRYVCRLIELLEIQRTGSSGEITDEILRGVIGKYVRVPHEAVLTEMNLPLKVTTLTGGLRRPYFFDE